MSGPVDLLKLCPAEVRDDLGEVVQDYTNVSPVRYWDARDILIVWLAREVAKLRTQMVEVRNAK